LRLFHFKFRYSRIYQIRLALSELKASAQVVFHSRVGDSLHLTVITSHNHDEMASDHGINGCVGLSHLGLEARIQEVDPSSS
jgi:hypothetical protein